MTSDDLKAFMESKCFISTDVCMQKCFVGAQFSYALCVCCWLMSSLHFQDVAQCFELFDRNHDGKITYAEVINAKRTIMCGDLLRSILCVAVFLF